MVKQMNKCLSGLLPCIKYSAGAVDKSYFDSDSAGRGFEPHHIRTLDTGRVCSSVVEQHVSFRLLPWWIFLSLSESRRVGTGGGF